MSPCDHLKASADLNTCGGGYSSIEHTTVNMDLFGPFANLQPHPKSNRFVTLVDLQPTRRNRQAHPTLKFGEPG